MQSKLRSFVCWIAILATVSAAARSVQAQDTGPPQLRCGIIGLDTSHAIAFTKLLNADNPPPELAGCRVVAAYPKGSPDIQSSVSRVPKYTRQIRDLGVEIVPSIAELLSRVDVVLLETNDGRPHLEQVKPVLEAGKRVFIDKPVAGSLSDAVAIFQLAEQTGTPLFSSSSLRYSSGAQAARNGKYGNIVECDAYSPAPLEPTHPDLFWYGIHGVETLFTVMGPGCESVTRTRSERSDVVVGAWSDGRIGSFRGIRGGKTGYGGVAYGDKQIAAPLTGYEGYQPLVVEIVKFFRSGKAPIDPQETLEIYAFMAAADRCKTQPGPVRIEAVMAAARAAARQRLAQLK